MTDETKTYAMLFLAGIVTYAAAVGMAEYRLGIMMEQPAADRVAHYNVDGWKCVAVIPTEGRREMTNGRKW